MKLEGRDADIRPLLDPKYIGSAEGSSVGELEQAAKDRGMHTSVLQNLSAADVAAIGKPVILLVRSSAEADKYDHFVLCFGADGDRLRILDAPNPPRLVSARELARLWGGVGIVVSSEPVSTWAMLGPTWAASIAWTGAAVVVVMAAGHGLRRLGRRIPWVTTNRRAWPSAAAQAAAVGAVALLGGVGFHLTATLGLLAHPEDVASIQETHVMSFARAVGAAGVDELMKGGAAVVDARFSEDYAAGHIPGAINIPVNQRAAAGRMLARRAGRDAKVILYCQSAGCPFSKQVGRVLWRDGYRNLYVFRGGWDEWEATARPAERP
jgi:rhodanese-related sulfurtransferase